MNLSIQNLSKIMPRFCAGRGWLKWSTTFSLYAIVTPPFLGLRGSRSSERTARLAMEHCRRAATSSSKDSRWFRGHQTDPRGRSLDNRQGSDVRGESRRA